MGVALQVSNGFLTADAFWLMVVAFVLVVGASVASRPVRIARADSRIVPVVAVGGLLVHLWMLYTSLPLLYLPRDASLVPFRWGVVALALAAGVLVWGSPRRTRPAQIAALVAAHFIIGCWVIRHSPAPRIDVFVFQRQAISALLSGHNPYAITFPNLYGGGVFYGPGMLQDGRLQFGFPYFPLSLLAALPGQFFGGDPRYAQLVAIEMAAVLMAFMRVGGFGAVAAALYLTTPRIFFVLEQAWTEPFVVLGVAAVVFAACRNSRSVPWLFGGLLALKQYLVLAVPAAALLGGWPMSRHKLTTLMIKATIVAVAVTLPFFLWNPGAFWKSVVTLQFYQPFRIDALSILAWWAKRGHAAPSALVAFLAAGIASGLALWRLPRTPAGFGAAVALTFFAFFFFNKQAFANYYFFVIGTLCASLAAWRAAETPE